MSTIASLDALRARREDILARQKARNGKIVINVSLATCSIAAGGKVALEAMQDEVALNGIANVEFMQSGCMTFCYAEPTVEITLPGKAPVVFGGVDEAKARELVTEYVMKGEPVEGIIPVTYERVVL
ncbi:MULTISPECIES: (2Fe-2S) ferredoxin domain-containing protein [Solidesulfovibrio]|jgi:NADP-reducing hydrogenase subunit HndB|uniref:NAD-reducing hydrogenase subunit n=2 Tax=Solidesulfovibrio TaxID=2910984 RepID=C4XGF7_SOLM1|nr:MULTISPECIES: (2Fe-2S) ferredoxin domain-containing protein [Solidesulfovibrio]QAZ65860.1 NADP oxidoreductase [Solidesulfovibrio carbinolicus]BAH73737.1 putative NAD-reducing hydrogenase subunit [Solidesulfovibrio magneticus RS-1]HML55697.1 (2Fe-2S) ferredoxin domain-containing protein [Solidesulfovibrio magneticus]